MNVDLGKHNIKSLFLKFVIPAIIGLLVNAVYIIVDGIFIGRGVGENGLAAINILWPIMCLNLAVGLLLGVGAATRISVKLGEKNIEFSKKILSVSIFSMILIGVIVMICGLVFLEPILKSLGATGEVLNLSKEYSRIIYTFTIFQILSTALNPIVRTEGNPKLAMNILIICAILNGILDWIFVIKLNLGMKGAALATIIGITFSAVYLLYYFISSKSILRINLKTLKFNVNIFMDIIASGFVSFAVELSFGVLICIQNKLLLKYGNTIDVAIFAIVGYIAVIFLETLNGIAQGIQPIIGYNYGAKKYDRVKEVLIFSIKMDIILGTLGLIIVFVFAKPMVHLFTNNYEIMPLAIERLKIYLISLPIIGIIVTSGSYYQAIHKNVYANIITLSKSFIFLIPASYILPKYMAVNGIFFAPLVANFITLIITIFILFIEKNKERKVMISEEVL